MKKLRVRIPIYLIGLFLMTIGIALSVKSDLGVSPVSSIPYTMTCVWHRDGKGDDPVPHRTGRFAAFDPAGGFSADQSPAGADRLYGVTAEPADEENE